MSIAIPLSWLQKEQLEEIIKRLTFKKLNNGLGQQSILVNFYELDTNNHLRLPFYYACGMLGSNVNLNRNILKVSNFTRQQILSSVQWREHQDVMMDEICKTLDTQHCCIIGSPPGSGKTVFGTIAAAIQNMGTLIICPRRGLIRQWADTITKLTPYGFIVDHIAEKELTPQQLIAKNRQPVVYIIYTPTLIDNVPAQILDQIGTLVVDEAHMTCTVGSIHALLATRPHKVILCTATAYRNNDGLENIMYYQASKVVINKIPPKPYRVFLLDTGWIYPEEMTNFKSYGRFIKGVNFDKLMKQIIKSPRYLMLLYHLTMQLSTIGRKIIILSQRLDLLSNLSSMLTYGKISHSTYYGKGDITFTEQQILLAGVAKGGTGFDEASFCEKFSGFKINTVVIASSWKFWGLLYQVVGRGLRGTDPWVIDVCHENNVLLKQRKERVEMYRSTFGDMSVRFMLQPELINILNQVEL